MADLFHIAEQKERGSGFFSREAVTGVPWMVFSKFVLFFIYFGVSILTVNCLGKEKYGVFSLMTNISSYLLVVCGLGLGSALMRYVPELAARKNRRGLVLLLWKSAALQIVSTVFVTLVLYELAEPLQRLFRAEHVENFSFYLMLACGLVGMLLFKDFITTVFTAVFKTRVVAMLSIMQGVVWLALLSTWLRVSPEITTVLYIQMAAIGSSYLIGAMYLYLHVHHLPWNTQEFGIGKRRALKFSTTAMVTAVLRLVMFKYSEIFFLAAVAGTTVAGVYDLGYTLPFTVVTFIPHALLPLFTAAFADAYVKDNSCLERLIVSYYKLLMMVSLPAAVLGTFFAPRVYHIIYKGEMDDAGLLASAFCLVLLLPLVSIPLSMALKAKEKVLDMLPMLMVQICVNLYLDWLLIVELRLGVWGGVVAVVGTFFLTIVPRMMVVRRLIGGIYFPARFFLRILFALLADAAAIHWATGKCGLFERFASDAVNVALLFLVGAVYLFIFWLLLRGLRLVRKRDLADFHALGIEKCNRVLDFLFGA